MQILTCFVWEPQTHIVHSYSSGNFCFLEKHHQFFPEYDTKNLLKHVLFNCKGSSENTVLPCLLVTLLACIWFLVSSANPISPMPGLPSLLSISEIPCHCQSCLWSHVALPSDSLMCHSTSLQQRLFQLSLFPPGWCGAAPFRGRAVLCTATRWNVLGHHQQLEGKTEPR